MLLYCQVWGKWVGCSEFYWHPVQMKHLQWPPESFFQSNPSFYPSSFLGSKIILELANISLDLGSLWGISSWAVFLSFFFFKSPYLCSFGWLSPATFPLFFQIYVVPGEFSGVSTSTFRDILYDEGQCLALVWEKPNRALSESRQSTQFRGLLDAGFFTSLLDWKLRSPKGRKTKVPHIYQSLSFSVSI